MVFFRLAVLLSTEAMTCLLRLRPGWELLRDFEAEVATTLRDARRDEACNAWVSLSGSLFTAPQGEPDTKRTVSVFGWYEVT